MTIMPDTAPTIDLRGATGARLAAYDAVQDIHPGDEAELLFSEEPSLIMEGASLMVRHRIHWEASAEDSGWRVHVRHRDAGEPTSVTELLQQDHERIDSLFATALRMVNEGDAAGARPLIEACHLGLRRHIYAENDVLTPYFDFQAAPDHNDPTSRMLHEHDNLVREVADILAEYHADGSADTGMLAPLMAITSGTLAKHEGREENEVFPLWAATLKQHPDPGLLERVRGILQGAEDDRLP
jgi:hemerythrin-like domain-containing protein